MLIGGGFVNTLLQGILSMFLLATGFCMGFIAFAYKTLIMSDIPISFTVSEALFAHVLFLIATALICISLSTLPSNAGRGMITGSLILTIPLNLLLLPTNLPGDKAGVALLQLAPVLHACFLSAAGIYLFIANWRRPIPLQKERAIQ